VNQNRYYVNITSTQSDWP